MESYLLFLKSATQGLKIILVLFKEVMNEKSPFYHHLENEAFAPKALEIYYFQLQMTCSIAPKHIWLRYLGTPCIVYNL